MHDRQPTPGKEGRVKFQIENGEIMYGTLAMADDPINEGTPLNKKTLLKDLTAFLYGFTNEAVPDDIFNQILLFITRKQKIVRATLLDYSGKPVSAVAINGLVNGNGKTVITDINGIAVGLASSGGTLTASTPGFLDTGTASLKLSDGTETEEVTLTIPSSNQDNLKFISSSTSVKFSQAVKTIDACLIGGGGAGGCSYYTYGSPKQGAGGGGGNLKNAYDITITPGKSYSIIIGAGGTLTGDGETKPSATNGGKTSAFGFTATGGTTADIDTPGVGNGNGGSAGQAGGPAVSVPFDDDSLGLEACGGGGGGRSGSSGTSGGNPNGGNGGFWNTGTMSGGTGADGIKPGGGGGGAYYYPGNESYGVWQGDGASGGVYIRWKTT